MQIKLVVVVVVNIIGVSSVSLCYYALSYVAVTFTKSFSLAPFLWYTTMTTTPLSSIFSPYKKLDVPV